jgi:hypothetical protein
MSRHDSRSNLHSETALQVAGHSPDMVLHNRSASTLTRERDDGQDTRSAFPVGAQRRDSHERDSDDNNGTRRCSVDARADPSAKSAAFLRVSRDSPVAARRPLTLDAEQRLRKHRLPTP